MVSERSDWILIGISFLTGLEEAVEEALTISAANSDVIPKVRRFGTRLHR